jgi:hypothetical protein
MGVWECGGVGVGEGGKSEIRSTKLEANGGDPNFEANPNGRRGENSKGVKREMPAGRFAGAVFRALFFSNFGFDTLPRES